MAKEAEYKEKHNWLSSCNAGFTVLAAGEVGGIRLGMG